MKNFTKGDCIHAIQLVCEELGETIDQKTYIRFKEMVQEWEIVASLFPDIQTIKKQCGSFEQALALSGKQVKVIEY